MPSRFQLRGHSMESLRWQLFDSYGTRARIIRAERIQTGGLFGIGATTSYEVTVEVDGEPPAKADAPTRRAAARNRAGRGREALRSGLANLLADADGGDRAIASTPVVISTQKPDFDVVLERVSSSMGSKPASSALPVLPAAPVVRLVSDEPADPSAAAPAEAAAPSIRAAIQDLGVAQEPGVDTGIPVPSSRAGDLVVLVGIRDHALRTAWTMAQSFAEGAVIRTAGDHRQEGVDHLIIDGHEVKKVQALAAIEGKPLLVAFSVGERRSSNAAVLSSVRADQLWLVVDAAHKPADTQAWVKQASWFSDPLGLAVLGSTETSTPESVNDLGYPVGWVDGYQSTSPLL